MMRLTRYKLLYPVGFYAGVFCEELPRVFGGHSGRRYFYQHYQQAGQMYRTFGILKQMPRAVKSLWRDEYRNLKYGFYGARGLQ